MQKVTVPKLDASIFEGMVGRWLKEAGSHVEKGEPLAEFVTDKATFEIESPCSGAVLSTVVAEKSVVPVGTIIALVGDPGEMPPDVTAENARILEEYRKNLEEGPVEEIAPQPAAPSSKPVQPGAATPAARALARKAGIDLTLVAPEKPGPVTEADVQRQIARVKKDGK